MKWLKGLFGRGDEGSLESWRKRAEYVTLPSGLRVGLRKINLIDLIQSGNIPVALLSMSEELEGLSVAEVGAKVIGQGGEDGVEEVFKLFDVVVMACVVDPPIGEEAGEGVLGVSELPHEDKEFVFQWANGGTEELRPFRGEEGES